jgi:hypothetical protein
MQTVLTTKAELVAEQIGFNKRPDKAKLSASTLTQTLVLGWLADPSATVEQLAGTASRLGLDISPQAIDQRFNARSAALLHQVLLESVTEVIAADPVAIPILQRFSGVLVQDSTTIVLPDQLACDWPGCGGSTADNTAAALKCGVQFDLLTGSLVALDLVSGRSSDQSLRLQHTTLPEGTLRLADLGFFDLQLLNRLSVAKVYWLSKLRSNSLVWTAEGQCLDLLAFVQSQARDGWDGWVWLGKQQALRARLLIQRVPQEVADQRRRRIRQEARDKGREPSAAALALADWTILITNIPQRLLKLAEALVVVRVRWQIELLFKLWKSQGRVDEWRSRKPQRILCEVYAKLIGLVIHHWMLAIGCWQYPDRSLVKAAQIVRSYALEIASARMRLPQLEEVLHSLVAGLCRTARINPRRKHPNTYQLLLELSTLPEQA